MRGQGLLEAAKLGGTTPTIDQAPANDRGIILADAPTNNLDGATGEATLRRF